MTEGSAIKTDAKMYNLVTFRLSQQVYALPIECIVQIIPMVTITPIPHSNGGEKTGNPASRALLGVINVRGVATPVIDLRRQLGLGEGKMLLYTPIVLCRLNNRTIGLVVDEVQDVVHLAEYEVTPLSQVLPEGTGENPYLRGMARIGDRLVPLLEVARLFGDEVAARESAGRESAVRENADRENGGRGLVSGSTLSEMVLPTL